MIASALLTYLVFYIKEVVGLTDYVSGLVLLAGQVADALTTPIVGILSDKT